MPPAPPEELPTLPTPGEEVPAPPTPGVDEPPRGGGKGGQGQGRQGMPDEVKNLLAEHRAEREARLAKMKELRQQLGGATKAEKDELRKQVRDLMREQRQDQVAVREQIREQVRERMEQLGKDLPGRKDVIEAAKERAKEQKPRSRGE